MKRLAVFLCGMLLLASCEDIDEARTLPKEFSIGDITDLSELTYDELEHLMINSNYYDPSYKEEMRRNGGLIIKGTVNVGNGEGYNDAYLWFSTKESDLPTDESNMWNAEGTQLLVNDANNLFFYLHNAQLANRDDFLATAFYYKMGLTLWNHEYPGFLDDCLQGDYYSYSVFSNVKTYKRPEVPYLLDCNINGGETISVDSRVRSRFPVTSGGICYSATNQLPTLKDEVSEVTFSESDNSTDTYLHTYAIAGEAGIYYVRAFAVSANGTGYSPVQRVTIY